MDTFLLLSVLLLVCVERVLPGFVAQRANAIYRIIIRIGRISMETGAAVSKQKIVDLKDRLLALKEHL
jgi:hypothetical protein